MLLWENQINYHSFTPMQRQTYILLTYPNGLKASYTSIFKMCEKNEIFSYYYLRNVKLPLKYKRKYLIERLKINE